MSFMTKSQNEDIICSRIDFPDENEAACNEELFVRAKAAKEVNISLRERTANFASYECLAES
jgi:hypothetical protein